MARPYPYPTLLLCGIAGGSLSLLPLKKHLCNSGIYARRWPAPPVLWKSVDDYAARVRRDIIKFHTQAGRRITLFGWSLGGAISIMALKEWEAAARVRRVITFGTPFDGTILAHAGNFFGVQVLKGAQEVLPGSETLETIRREVARNGRTWELITINGSLDPLAPHPQESVFPDLREGGSYTHLAPFSNPSLKKKVVELIKQP